MALINLPSELNWTPLTCFVFNILQQSGTRLGEDRWNLQEHSSLYNCWRELLLNLTLFTSWKFEYFKSDCCFFIYLYSYFFVLEKKPVWLLLFFLFLYIYIFLSWEKKQCEFFHEMVLKLFRIIHVPRYFQTASSFV